MLLGCLAQSLQHISQELVLGSLDMSIRKLYVGEKLKGVLK